MIALWGFSIYESDFCDERALCAVNLYLEVDGESKGYRQVKCESKTYELELLISNLMDPIGKTNIVSTNFYFVILAGGDQGTYREQVQRKQLVAL
jgi:hypothetical protein